MAAFRHFDVDVEHIVLVAVHGVRHNLGVAVTAFVVLLNNLLFVLGVFGLDIFRRFENVVPRFLLGALHCPADFAVAQHLVALDVDVLDFHLAVFLHVEVQNDGVGHHCVLFLLHVDLHIVEAFFDVELADALDGRTNHIVGNLDSANQFHFVFQVVGLRFRDARKFDSRQPRALFQLEVEIDFIVGDFGDVNLHIAEKAVLPEFFERF